MRVLKVESSCACRPVSGGSMNPARTLGPAVASQKYDSIWIYLIGPVMGTLMGSFSYNFIRLNEKPSSAQMDGGSAHKHKLPSLKLRRLQSQEMANNNYCDNI